MTLYPEKMKPRRDISCETCTAACCRKGTMITMTPSEVVVNIFKIKREVLLEPANEARELPVEAAYGQPAFTMVVPPNTEISILSEDCGHITPENKCAIYDSNTRPGACAELVPGSEACMYIRQQAGIADPPRGTQARLK